MCGNSCHLPNDLVPSLDDSLDRLEVGPLFGCDIKTKKDQKLLNLLLRSNTQVARLCTHFYTCTRLVCRH